MKFSDFLMLKDFKKDELYKILRASYELKHNVDRAKFKPMANKTMAMIFEKPSTRTRVSFEVGMYELGGQALYLHSNDIQIGRGETIEDTARILSQYVDIIMIRAFEQEKIKTLAKFSNVPVINGLSDECHPCQTLSDIFSIFEFKNFDVYKDNTKNLNKMNLLYIGDGSNVLNSLMQACAIFGMNISIVCPRGYEPEKKTLLDAQKIAKRNNCEIFVTNNIKEIKKKVDVIYTDIWTSMGKEAEQKKRQKDFKNYQVNRDFVDKIGKKDVIIMHCLPAHRGEEITDEVIESKNSRVFEQAGNRLHVQKAIILYCLKEKIKTEKKK